MDYGSWFVVYRANSVAPYAMAVILGTYTAEDRIDSTFASELIRASSSSAHGLLGFHRFVTGRSAFDSIEFVHKNFDHQNIDMLIRANHTYDHRTATAEARILGVIRCRMRG